MAGLKDTNSTSKQLLHTYETRISQLERDLQQQRKSVSESSSVDVQVSLELTQMVENFQSVLEQQADSSMIGVLLGPNFSFSALNMSSSNSNLGLGVDSNNYNSNNYNNNNAQDRSALFDESEELNISQMSDNSGIGNNGNGNNGNSGNGGNGGETAASSVRVHIAQQVRELKSKAKAVIRLSSAHANQSEQLQRALDQAKLDKEGFTSQITSLNSVRDSLTASALQLNGQIQDQDIQVDALSRERDSLVNAREETASRVRRVLRDLNAVRLVNYA